MLEQFIAQPAFEWRMVPLIFGEGLAAFLSPCVLPMLPVYLLYLGGDTRGSRGMVPRTAGFVSGFTLVFLAMGAGATALGQVLQDHAQWLMRAGGVILILLGLSYLGLFEIPFLRGREGKAPGERLTPLRAIGFGAAFAFSWTPCLGTFLGAALIMAAQAASLWHGLLLLFAFSMGLGVPFVLCALLYGRLTGMLAFLKRHLRLIQTISGALLILFGLMMLLGWFGYWQGLLQ